jgi:uncharacterized protein (DUF1501 family)
MKRREFLAAAAVAGTSCWLPGAVRARAAVSAMHELPGLGAGPGPGHENLLILVELKGGNDGLNTVVPFSDPLYYRYRRHIAVRRDAAIALDEHTALHPSLAPLMSLWRAQQLAIVQGVGYEPSSLSHFRSIEVWDTASRSNEYLSDGWLTRAFAQRALPVGFAAEGVIVGDAEAGPFANGARVISLHPRGSRSELKTTFPSGPFGEAIKTAMDALAPSHLDRSIATVNAQHVAAIRLTLNGFDTHHRQPARHAALLAQLADGIVAMRNALVELGRWERTLIVTYSEFGRRAIENDSRGTDHGTAAAHFVAGGRVRGGLYGESPRLAHVDGNGNLPAKVDFRRIYASVLGPWWGLDAQAILRERLEPLPLLRV